MAKVVGQSVPSELTSAFAKVAMETQSVLYNRCIEKETQLSRFRAVEKTANLNLEGLLRVWSQLTERQKATWSNQYAPVGESGYIRFIRTNALRLANGLPLLYSNSSYIFGETGHLVVNLPGSQALLQQQHYGEYVNGLREGGKRGKLIVEIIKESFPDVLSVSVWIKAQLEDAGGDSSHAFYIAIYNLSGGVMAYMPLHKSAVQDSSGAWLYSLSLNKKFNMAGYNLQIVISNATGYVNYSMLKVLHTVGAVVNDFARDHYFSNFSSTFFGIEEQLTPNWVVLQGGGSIVLESVVSEELI